MLYSFESNPRLRTKFFFSEDLSPGGFFGFCISLLVAALFAFSIQAQPQSQTRAGLSSVPEPGSVVLSFAGLVNGARKQIAESAESGTYNAGLGALVEANINGTFGIETGALLLARQYEVSSRQARLIQEMQRLHVPVTARAWVGDFVSLAAGPFVAFGVGSERAVVEVGDTQVAGLRTAAEQDVEFGIDGAATFNFAVSQKTGIFVEGRYSYLLGDAQNENADQISALAGVKLDL